MKKIKYLKEPLSATDEQASWLYELIVPDTLAEWDVFSYWERERTLSIRDNLSRGDVLFDIGAEQGWLSAVMAKIVGSENLVLVEPSSEFWANIRAIFESNDLGMPRACFDGFFSDETDREGLEIKTGVWPESSKGEIIGSMAYRNLFNGKDLATTNQVSLDYFVEQTGIVPDALNIDVEGSEYLVLKGAEKTLEKYKPKIWVSVHEDMLLRDYDTEPDTVREFIKSFGYNRTVLASDHESHELYD